MNPVDASPRDYRLYYNQSYMLHDKHGVVYVQVGDGSTLLCKKIGEVRTSRWIPCSPETLTYLWPEPKAINFGSRGLYIGRRARREARRSATVGHYYVAWGSDMLGHTMMKEFIFPSDYPSLEEAIDKLNNREWDSAAINRDIIITDTLGVVTRGHNVGQMITERGQYAYCPTLADSPLCKRTAFKLGKEGILCL